jgi:hypothetical protein
MQAANFCSKHGAIGAVHYKQKDPPSAWYLGSRFSTLADSRRKVAATKRTPSTLRTWGLEVCCLKIRLLSWAAGVGGMGRRPARPDERHLATRPTYSMRHAGTPRPLARWGDAGDHLLQSPSPAPVISVAGASFVSDRERRRGAWGPVPAGPPHFGPAHSPGISVTGASFVSESTPGPPRMPARVSGRAAKNVSRRDS